MQRIRIERLLVCWGFLVFVPAAVWGQKLQQSGVVYLQTIPVPGWKATGTPGSANVDVMGYTPVTRTMYLADRTNHGST
jgi:hypothetical protein